MVAAESALVTLCSLYGGSGKCAGYFMVAAESALVTLWWQRKVHWLLYAVFMVAVESVLVTSHSLYDGSRKCAGYFMVTTLG